MYVTSQIIAAVSTLILITYAVMKVNRNVILICNIAINVLLGVHYLLLESYSGAICSGITAIMVWVFCYKDKCEIMRLRIFGVPVIPIFFTVLFIVSGYLSWQDVWSVIPVTGNILLVIALWNDNENIIKGIFIIVGLMWIILNLHLRSVANIVGQCLSVTSNIIYFVRIKKQI